MKGKLAQRAWVFAGGHYRVSDLDTKNISSDDLIVGVDHGIEHCLASDLTPDILIGDFDSVEQSLLSDPRLEHAERINYLRRKDQSDLELALEHLAKSAVNSVTLLGVSGGRSDHHLFNWMLSLQKSWPFSLELIDDTVHAYLVSAQFPLTRTAQQSQIVSLLPMPRASGVCTSGLEYPLNNASLLPGSTLGLSNVANESIVQVSVSDGSLLAFFIREQATANKRT